MLKIAEKDSRVIAGCNHEHTRLSSMSQKHTTPPPHRQTKQTPAMTTKRLSPPRSRKQSYDSSTTNPLHQELPDGNTHSPSEEFALHRKHGTTLPQRSGAQIRELASIRKYMHRMTVMRLMIQVFGAMGVPSLSEKHTKSPMQKSCSQQQEVIVSALRVSSMVRVFSLIRA